MSPVSHRPIEDASPGDLWSEILAHSDVEVTLNVYDHPEIENFREPPASVGRSVVTRCYEIGAGDSVND